ncbi:hypothetical protein RB195_014178 [Necator americanus]|uniref:Uncharacterized protein n=1 Tax=Necator americanus TaxID=51031 RepID=A0ABR1DZ08_NECAM
MPCSLFVATVRGSRQCAVCQCTLDAHSPDAIYVEPSKIFTAPSTPRTERKQPRMGGLETSEKSAFSPYSSPQQHLSYGDSASVFK